MLSDDFYSFHKLIENIYERVAERIFSWIFLFFYPKIQQTNPFYHTRIYP